MRPIDFVKDWACIVEDLTSRCDGVITDECKVYDFDQMWGSTALGFGGVGGSMMTNSRTYIIVNANRAYVYFSGLYAYDVPYPFNKEFHDDMEKHSLASVLASAKYWRTDND